MSKKEWLTLISQQVGFLEKFHSKLGKFHSNFVKIIRLFSNPLWYFQQLSTPVLVRKCLLPILWPYLDHYHKLKKFGCKLENFHSKLEIFHSNREKFHSKLETFHSKLEKFHSTHLLWNDRSPFAVTLTLICSYPNPNLKLQAQQFEPLWTRILS